MKRHSTSVKRPARLSALRRGMASTEYMLILALIVLPLALMLPFVMRMVTLYGNRIVLFIGLPFP